MMNNCSEAVLEHVCSALRVFRSEFKLCRFIDPEEGGAVFVRVDEPSLINGIVEKWEKYSRHLSNIGYSTEKQLGNAIMETQYYRDKAMEDASPYIEENPVIVFRGSSFVFTGIGDYDKEHPIVKAIIVQGGVCRQSVSGRTNYLVIGAEPGSAKIEAALNQKRLGKPVHIIRFEDLEKALKRNQV